MKKNKLSIKANPMPTIVDDLTKVETQEQIIALLLANATTVHRAGSCGELGDSFMAIDSDCFSELADKILQNFEPKKCMPDGINSKDEHEQYLYDICYEKYRKIEEFKKENPNELTSSQQNYLPVFLDIVRRNDVVFAHVDDFTDEREDLDAIFEKLANSYNELLNFKNVHKGLCAFDKNIENIFENIPCEDACETVVEAYLVQQINYLKSILFHIH